MANVMCLVSKAGFSALEKELGSLEVGVTRPIDAYHSASKTLNKLSEGGTLFLVTVRDGALWLLGVLENPTFDGASWRAAPNTTPVCDVSTLVPAFQFEHGRGLNVAAEKLAMSLQTPRVLADHDVSLLRSIATPSPNTAYRAAVASLGGTSTTTQKPARGKTPSRTTATKIPSVETWQQAVASVDAWTTLDADTRTRFVHEIAAALGPQFEPLPYTRGVAHFGALKSSLNGLEFVIIPGGSCIVGFTADDIMAVLNVLASDELDDYHLNYDDFEYSRPPHQATVAPFIVARDLVHIPDDPAGTLAADGFRIVSEVEWEWIGREGGPIQFVSLPLNRHPLGPTHTPPVNDEENGWGIRGLLNEEQIVADHWHHYTESPSTSAAWTTDDPTVDTDRYVMRSGHTWWQSGEEAVALHAAYRSAATLGLARPAMSLGIAPQPEPMDWSSTVSLTIDSITSRRVEDRQRATIALRTCSRKLGTDSALLTAALIDALPTAPKARRVQLATNIPPVTDELRKRVDVVLELMNGSTPVRAYATRLVAALKTEDALAFVRAALTTERNHEVRAGLICAFDILTEALGVDAPEFDEWLNHANPLVVAAAALAKIRRGCSDLETFTAAARVASVAATPDLPWFDGNLGAAARRALDDSGPEIRDAVAAVLIERVHEDGLIAKTVVNFLFGPRRPRHEIRLPEELSPVQRDAVEAFSALPKTAQLNIPWADFGLPSIAMMRRWLDLDPPSFVTTPHVWPWEDGEVTMPLWRWTRALRQLATTQNWPVAQYVEAIERGLARVAPLHMLELEFDSKELRIGLPYQQGTEFGRFPHANFQEVLAKAAAADLAATLAFVERRLIENPGWHSWAVEFFLEHHPEGTMLPPTYHGAVAFSGKDEKRKERHWSALPAAVRQTRVITHLYDSIANGCVAWGVIEDLTKLETFWEMTPPIAAGLLALGSMQLKYSKAEGASKLVTASDDPDVQAIYEQWRAVGGHQGGKATQIWKKTALKLLLT